ncbi:MAG TPA: response regulator, partial [Nitrospirae bacterium]|nr:response regulator [Nitrospirota bacterium]
MVVDDEPIVGKRLKRLFKKEGYEVEAFTRSASAIMELDKKTFDIIITDL